MFTRDVPVIAGSTRRATFLRTPAPPKSSDLTLSSALIGRLAPIVMFVPEGTTLLVLGHAAQEGRHRLRGGDLLVLEHDELGAANQESAGLARMAVGDGQHDLAELRHILPGLDEDRVGAARR